MIPYHTFFQLELNFFKIYINDFFIFVPSFSNAPVYICRGEAHYYILFFIF